jgi:hypothetical protein
MTCQQRQLLTPIKTRTVPLPHREKTVLVRRLTRINEATAPVANAVF